MKNEIPDFKPQIPNKSKSPNSNDQNWRNGGLGFCALNLFGIWGLGFGISD
jgi:hypothetical protein